MGSSSSVGKVVWGGKRYGVVYAMIQCKNSQVYQCVSVSVSVWQEVVAYYCITNDRQPPPRRHLAARMRQLTYLSAQDMKRLRYCRQLFICRYPYTRIHTIHSCLFILTVVCGFLMRGQAKCHAFVVVAAAFNIYLFASASRNALKPIK